eukprot:1159394-Pelagomonas_calceolata.AAC.19
MPCPNAHSAHPVTVPVFPRTRKSALNQPHMSAGGGKVRWWEGRVSPAGKTTLIHSTNEQNCVLCSRTGT